MDNFFIACSLMGLGIGVDVAIATALRARSLRQQKMTVLWIGGVSLTHTLFPMIGYLLTYFSLQSLPAITPLIGIIASGLIIWFLWSELFSQNEDSEGQHLMVTLGIILAVSWDALWSGPAKSAQVEGWSELMIWLSFLLVGVVVLACAVLAYRLGMVVCNKYLESSKSIVAALWLQYSVIAYFALLAFSKYTLSIELAWWLILLVAMLSITLVMILKDYLVAQRKGAAVV